MSACACLGPMFNEPFCSCEMKQRDLPRSPEYLEYYSEENVKKRSEEMQRVFSQTFGWENGKDNL